MLSFCSPIFVHHQKRIRLRSTEIKSKVATSTATTNMRVDAHVHVWDNTFPCHPSYPLPPIPGSASDLIKNMDAAGVDKTLVVQPINYMFDHTCVRAATKEFPTRLYGIALANTSETPDEACAQLEDLVLNGFRGVRINPTFTGDTFSHGTVVSVGRKAGELDVPVMLFAKPKHIPDIEQFVRDCPETKVIIDHFGFAAPDELQTQAALRELAARHSNVFIKTSAWFRVSKTGWPHQDMFPFLKSLIDTVGPDRLLLGSDYPFVTEQYDYSQAFSLLETAVKDSDRTWIDGESAKRLFKL